MRPRFVPPGETPPTRSLAVDGALTGCTASYSHWRGFAAPAEIAADTATAILLRASRRPERWLDGFDWCCNDHVDGDGLLAMAMACRPELATSYGPLMVGAASYGDFCAWPGAAAAQLALRIHQLLVTERSAGGAWEQRCCERTVSDLESLVVESETGDDQRDAQVEQILDRRQAIEHRDDPSLSLLGHRRVCSNIAPLVHGHHPDDSFTVHQPDDIPPWAVHGYVPADFFQLLVLRSGTGTGYQLDAPRHSWAQTVHLPQVTWPDCSALAAELQAADDPATRWVAGEAARARGFTCLLATVDASGAAALSSLAHERVVAAVERLLAREG